MKPCAKPQTLLTGPKGSVSLLQVRTTLFVTLILITNFSLASEAYLIIDAVRLPSTKNQPTWIALKKKGQFRYVHLRTGESIVSVEPGIYSLKHIDFQKNQRSGIGTLIFDRENEIRFEAVPDSITYVGLIHIKYYGWRRGKKKYDAKIRQADKIFEWACYNRPGLFEQKAVRFPDKDGSIKQIRVRCKT